MRKIFTITEKEKCSKVNRTVNHIGKQKSDKRLYVFVDQITSAIKRGDWFLS